MARKRIDQDEPLDTEGQGIRHPAPEVSQDRIEDTEGQGRNHGAPQASESDDTEGNARKR